MRPTWWTPRRRRLAAWSAPVWIAAVLTSGTLIAKTVDNAAGRQAYAVSDMTAARERFERTHRLNVVQPWIAAHNRGTANYGLRNHPAAKADFAEALRTVPKAQDCLVRLNLVATIEVMGDELAVARRHAEAEAAYAEGLTVLSQGQCGDPARRPTASPSPSGTRSPTSGPSGQPTSGPSGQPTEGKPTEGKPSSQPTSGERQRRDEQERAGESEDRLEEKRREEQTAKEREQRSPRSPTPQPSAEPNPEPVDQRIERVEKQNEEARKQQQRSRDREKRNGTDVERPW